MVNSVLADQRKRRSGAKIMYKTRVHKPLMELLSRIKSNERQSVPLPTSHPSLQLPVDTIDALRTLLDIFIDVWTSFPPSTIARMSQGVDTLYPNDRESPVILMAFNDLSTFYKTFMSLFVWNKDDMICRLDVSIQPLSVINAMLGNVGFEEQLRVLNSSSVEGPVFRCCVVLQLCDFMPYSWISDTFARSRVLSRHSVSPVSPQDRVLRQGWEGTLRDTTRFYDALRIEAALQRYPLTESGGCVYCVEQSGVAPSPPSSLRKRLKLKACSACKIAKYCGIEHQRLDWPVHKAHCKRIRELEQSFI